MSIPDIYIFYGCISLLPLFFLYLLYRNLAWRWQWKQWFDEYYAARGQVARRKDVERLITELSSSDSGLNIGGLRRIEESGAMGVNLVLAALDLPYHMTRTGKYVFPDGEATSIFGKSVKKIHSLLSDALVNIGHHSPNELVAALQSPNLNVRTVAMHVLGHLNYFPAVDALLMFMDSPNLDEKAFAMKALGELGVINAVDSILSVLNDNDVYVRATAIVALGNIGDPRALPFLEEISQFDKTLIDGTDQTLGQLAEMAVVNIRNRKPV
jgi:hypothetical protein